MIKINKKFLLLLAVFIICSLWIGGIYTYLLLYSAILIFFLSYIYIRLIKHRITIEMKYNKDYYCVGDKLEFLTKVNFDLPIPIPFIRINSEAMKFSEEKYIGELTNINYDENKWIRSNIYFERRGIYKLGKISFNVSDVFGIFNYSVDIDNNNDIKVYPKQYNINNLEKGGKDVFLERTDKNSTNEEQFAIKDVRKYRWGDSLKKIHWKLSAKLGELFVKNTDTISGEEYVILTDMNKKNFELYGIHIEEKIIDITASLLKYLIIRGISTKVFLNDSVMTLLNIESEQNYEDFLENIIIRDSDSDLPFEEFIHCNIFNIHKTSLVIIVIAALDERLVNNLLYLKEYGYEFSIHYCIENESSRQLKDKLFNWGINCVFIEEISNYNEGEQLYENVVK